MKFLVRGRCCRSFGVGCGGVVIQIEMRWEWQRENVRWTEVLDPIDCSPKLLRNKRCAALLRTARGKIACAQLEGHAVNCIRARANCGRTAPTCAFVVWLEMLPTRRCRVAPFSTSLSTCEMVLECRAALKPCRSMPAGKVRRSSTSQYSYDRALGEPSRNHS